MKKVAIVTGGSGVLGKAISNHLIKKGIIVISCYNKNAIPLKKNQSNQVDIFPLKMDLNNKVSIKKAFKKVFEIFGRIDFLINNAGYTIQCEPKDLKKMKFREIDKIFKINVFGSIFSSFEALDYFKMQQKKNKDFLGSVINISSNSIKTHNASNLFYISSKAALQSITESMALHYGNISRFNVVAPGLVKSKLTEKTFDKIYDRVLSRTSMKRLIEPKDIAITVNSILQDMTMVNGQTIYVDGGRTIGD